MNSKYKSGRWAVALFILCTIIGLALNFLNPFAKRALPEPMPQAHSRIQEWVAYRSALYRIPVPTLEEPWSAMNPAITTWDDDSLLVSVQLVSYTIERSSDGARATLLAPRGYLYNHLVLPLLRLGPSGAPIWDKGVPQLVQDSIRWRTGQADTRLFRSQRYGLVAVGGSTEPEVAKWTMARSSQTGETQWSVDAAWLLCHPDMHGTQKNWMPIAELHNGIAFLAQVAPWTLVVCNETPHASYAKCTDNWILRLFAGLGRSEAPYAACETIVSVEMPSEFGHLRSSTPAVTLPNKRFSLMVVHQRFHDPVDRYTHRFVLVDTILLKPLAISDEFVLSRGSVDTVFHYEYVSGLAVSRGRIVLTFGIEDREPWLAVLPLRGLQHYLHWLDPKPDTYNLNLHADS